MCSSAGGVGGSSGGHGGHGAGGIGGGHDGGQGHNCAGDACQGPSNCSPQGDFCNATGECTNGVYDTGPCTTRDDSGGDGDIVYYNTKDTFTSSSVGEDFSRFGVNRESQDDWWRKDEEYWKKFLEKRQTEGNRNLEELYKKAFKKDLDREVPKKFSEEMFRLFKMSNTMAQFKA